MARKIMVVDDSAIVRQQVSWALVEGGYEVVEAVDGQDAVERIAASPDVAMMVCDVSMPRLNGLELLEKLGGENKTPPFPVLMLTTEGHAELVAQAKGLGAKGWMVKPVRPEILLATVRKLAGA
jgi:two-component system chemotaxis response regulator CheY